MTLVIRFLRQKAPHCRGPFRWMNHQNKCNTKVHLPRCFAGSWVNNNSGHSSQGRKDQSEQQPLWYPCENMLNTLLTVALKSHLIECRILHVSYISSGPVYTWDNETHFWWQGKLTFLPSKRGPGSADLLPEWKLPQSTIIYWASIICEKYVAFYSIWHMFSPVTHMTISHVRVWWRSWPLHDGWQNWCLGEIYSAIRQWMYCGQRIANGLYRLVSVCPWFCLSPIFSKAEYSIVPCTCSVW